MLGHSLLGLVHSRLAIYHIYSKLWPRMGIPSQQRKTRTRALRDRSTASEGSKQRNPRLTKIEQLHRQTTSYWNPPQDSMPKGTKPSSGNPPAWKPPQAPSTKKQKQLKSLDKFKDLKRVPGKDGHYKCSKTGKEYVCLQCTKGSSYHKGHEIWCQHSIHHGKSFDEVMQKANKKWNNYYAPAEEE